MSVVLILLAMPSEEFVDSVTKITGSFSRCFIFVLIWRITKQTGIRLSRNYGGCCMLLEKRISSWAASRMSRTLTTRTSLEWIAWI